MYKENMPKFGVGKNKNDYKQGIKDPIIMIDTDYIGDFSVQKTMKIDIVKYGPSWMEDWLPCCSGGFFDIPSYNFDKERGSQKGIFDCTCRNESIKTSSQRGTPQWRSSQQRNTSTTPERKSGPTFFCHLTLA